VAGEPTGCANGEQQVCGPAWGETRFHFRTRITSVVPWLVVPTAVTRRARSGPRITAAFATGAGAPRTGMSLVLLGESTCVGAGMDG
jgi:hypothetical protein